jgi:8-oxo-dGTP pyrophosphatase MutT (NUDIX family)
VKRGETLEQAAQREVGEEVGARVGKMQLQGMYLNTHEHKSDHVAVFSCSDFVLTGKTDAEIAYYDWFSLGSLPVAIGCGTRRRLAEYVSGAHRSDSGSW